MNYEICFPVLENYNSSIECFPNTLKEWKEYQLLQNKLRREHGLKEKPLSLHTLPNIYVSTNTCKNIRGLFSRNQIIEKGELITEFEGKEITTKEFNEIYPILNKDKIVYLKPEEDFEIVDNSINEVSIKLTERTLKLEVHDLRGQIVFKKQKLVETSKITNRNRTNLVPIQLYGYRLGHHILTIPKKKTPLRRKKILFDSSLSLSEFDKSKTENNKFILGFGTLANSCDKEYQEERSSNATIRCEFDSVTHRLEHVNVIATETIYPHTEILIDTYDL